MTMHRWCELTTWEGAAQLAASLHEDDGYSSRSQMPAPAIDGCLSPTPNCVASGWALELAGAWCCTAPENMVPIEYARVGCPCAARKHNARAGLSPELPENLGRYHEPPDFETVSVTSWLRNALKCISVGAMPEQVRDYAGALLRDTDHTTDLETVKSLGTELVRQATQQGVI